MTSYKKKILDKGNKARKKASDALDSTLLFQRSLNVSNVRNEFKQKLVDEGLNEADAEKSVYQLSKGDLDQVNKDLKRHPKIVVINESTGKEHHFSADDFSNNEKTELFLRSLTNNDPKMYDYLCTYLHQGGFLHLSELLISYYFAPDTRFTTDNRVATFTIKPNGAITFEEKFDIQKVATDSDSFEKTSHKPLATISLKSIIQKDKNNAIQHHCGDIKLKVRDEVASQFFIDPRGKFQKCLSWMKETLVSILNHANYKAQAAERNRIGTHPKKI